ncbi:MAG: type II toxin-antitoxin system mRNA interferase toxin, RelE/StbE family [Patescibacteria group bacterium]|nr:type II toxin-antitoxin system mRNA interferase toxin, RelE/StbE family [Patescibacteria group bacterium]
MPPELKEEAMEKIELLRDVKNHKQIKVHKLGGRLKGRYSFSVNFKTRIVFRYLNTKKPQEVLLTAIGDHDVYR